MWTLTTAMLSVAYAGYVIWRSFGVDAKYRAREVDFDHLLQAARQGDAEEVESILSRHAADERFLNCGRAALRLSQILRGGTEVPPLPLMEPVAATAKNKTAVLASIGHVSAGSGGQESFGHHSTPRKPIATLG